MAICYTVSVNCRTRNIELSLADSFKWFRRECEDAKKGDVVRLDAESLLKSDFPPETKLTHIPAASAEVPAKWAVCLFSYQSEGKGDIMVKARQWFEDGEVDSTLMVAVGAITEAQILSMYLNSRR